MNAVGELIKVHREKRKLTQVQAGRMLRVTAQFINRIERGDHMPLSRARKIRKVLNIKYGDMLSALVKDYTGKVSKDLKFKGR